MTVATDLLPRVRLQQSQRHSRIAGRQVWSAGSFQSDGAGYRQSPLWVPESYAALGRTRMERKELRRAEGITRAHYSETADHSLTVVSLARLIGLVMGLDSDAQRRVELGALGHDFGKWAVRAQVLAKPGIRTDAEFEEIQEHPEAGPILVDLCDLPVLEEAKPFMVGHHVYPDGSGYPKMKFQEIGPEVPIATMADTAAVVHFGRIYQEHPPLSLPQVVERLRPHRGTQFVPEVFDAFEEGVSSTRKRLLLTG